MFSSSHLRVIRSYTSVSAMKATPVQKKREKKNSSKIHAFWYLDLFFNGALNVLAYKILKYFSLIFDYVHGLFLNTKNMGSLSGK